MYKTLFKDAYSKSQESDKVSAKRFGPFFVKKLVGKNAVKLEVQSHFKIRDVIHFVHTTPYHEQPSDIGAPVTKRPDPVPAVGGEEYVVESTKNTERGETAINSSL